MQADDHGPGFAGGVPVLQGQPRAVEADEIAILQARAQEARARRPGLLGQGRAGGDEQQGGESGDGPHASISATRARR